MAWTIEIDPGAEKALRKIPKKQVEKLFSYLRSRALENPRQFGKSLKGRLAGLWRYRVGNYRMVCQLQDDKLVVLVVKVGHHKEIYK